MSRTALVVGAGAGISASFARLLAGEGHEIALASRNPAKVAALAGDLKATMHVGDAADPASVDRLFEQIDRQFPTLDVCLFNTSARAPGRSPRSTPIRPAPHFSLSPTAAFSFVRLPPSGCCPMGPATSL